MDNIPIANVISYLLLIILCTLAIVSCGREEDDDSQTDTQTVKKLSVPIFESPLDIASDPAVIRVDSNTLHLYYTAENSKIGLVVSTDNGSSWHHPNGLTTDDFAVLQGQTTKWDKVLETVDVIEVGSEYWMYYTGYREGESDNPWVQNFQVGLAISTDGGLTFVRHAASVESPIIPINALNDASMDRHAITSPSVVLDDDGQFFMTYTGWNTSNGFMGPGAGFWIVGATSSDGITWNKLSNPLLTAELIPWTTEGINEADITLAPNGTWYFLFTAEEGIGVATSDSFFGPYSSALNNPLIIKEYTWEKAEVVAPNVLIDDGILIAGRALRIWYVGIETDAFFPAVIGYAEAPYPLNSP